ncbi:MAG: hypothetical protein IJP90_08300 [Treponema sp.]|nr:hypothetical protein [Treponema sp.]MBR0099705.1 hypothetical protein [Treponema sp.]
MKKIFLIFLSLFFVLTSIFSAGMSPRVRQVPKIIQKQVFVTPKETLPELVKFLTNGIGDTAGKVKVFHDWICDNIAYDCDVFTEQGAGEQGYEAVLKKKKGVCIGYANVFNAMCYYAGIEQKTVTGWSKGFNYPGYLRKDSDHAWNIVKIGNKWQQIDITWDAGFVEGQSFIKHYTTQWYNLTPAQFIYSHLPDEDEWQLLPEKQVRSHAQFEKEPYVPGIFFGYGLSFGKEVPWYTNEISGASGFDFVSSKNGVSIMGSLRGENPETNLKLATWFENGGNTRRFIFDVPDKKIYTANFGARINGALNNPQYFSRTDFEQNVLPKANSLLTQKKITKGELDLFEKSYFLIKDNDRYYYAEDLFDNPRNAANTKILKLLERNTSRYENVLDFRVKASETYAGFGNGTKRFPQMYLAYQSSPKMKVDSPLQGKLRKGREYHFSLETNAFSYVAIVLSENDFIFFKKNQKTGVFELDFTVPENVTAINIFASKNNKEYAALLSYEAE